MPLLLALPLMFGLLLLRRRPGLFLRLALLTIGLIMVAACATVVLGTLLLVGGTGLAILAALALLLRPWKRRRPLRAAEAVVENGAPRSLFRGGLRGWWRRERTSMPDPLLVAWQRLAAIAPWSLSRINAARTSIVRLTAAAETQPLNVELVEWVEVARRRVPELVERCSDGLIDRTPVDRQTCIDAHLDMIEAIAAEADRRVDRHRPADDALDLATHRAWLAQHLARPTPLSPI